MKKTYKITVEYDDLGKSTLKRVSKGFNAMELLGVITQAQQSILDQMEGRVKFDKTELKASKTIKDK